MSADIAIRIENLGKRYRYGGVAPLSYSLRQDITDWLKGLFRRPQQPGGTRSVASEAPARHETLHEVHERHLNESPEYFWALKDINLEIKQGEVVGIIGRNGAGKSTLLKILSRITPPSRGRITYHGRVASLLEVGTGFHRELTGRENIYLNGSILGMKRAEITRKLDEIIAFAEVEKFIDTPVKFYSSGMYVRLAFAVAAHLEPEILVVDEVLAVGDAEFQKKCLGKMGEVAKGGRTILFISHNMGAITTLCNRAVFLQQGFLLDDGETNQVVSRYLTSTKIDASIPLVHRTDRTGTGEVRFIDCRLTKLPDGPSVNDFFVNEDLYVILRLQVRQPARFWLAVGITDQMSQRFIMTTDTSMRYEPIHAETGELTLILHYPKIKLLEGTYSLSLAALKDSTTHYYDRISDALSFRMLPTDIYDCGRTVGSYQGLVHLESEWLNSEYQPLTSSQR